MENTGIKKGVNSLNIRKMFSKEELKVIANSDNVNVCRVIGKVVNIEQDKGQHGEYYNLMGIFEGTNLQTGELIGARKCNLPGLAEAEIVEAFKAVAEKAKKGAIVEIEFGYDFSVMPNTKEESVGYEFACAPLMKQTIDPLAALKKSLPALPKAQAKIEGKKKEELATV